LLGKFVDVDVDWLLWNGSERAGEGGLYIHRAQPKAHLQGGATCVQVNDGGSQAPLI
jgi:hypothetical protein